MTEQSSNPPLPEAPDPNTTAGPQAVQASAIVNTVTDDVTGQVVQAGQVSGDIHFHAPMSTSSSAAAAVPSPHGEVGLVGRVLHLRGDRLPTVSQVELIALRVKPAIESDTDTDTHQPPYVGRDVDAGLREVIHSGGMVLLHGRAAAGKSRAGLQALRAVRPHDPLLVPRDGVALRELVEAGQLDTGPLVVWLDDLERFLGPTGFDMPLLQRLCPAGRTRVSVVATMRDEELASYDHAATANRGTSLRMGMISRMDDQAGLRLLEQLHGIRRVHVRQTLSDTERVGAVEQAGVDPRVARALHAQEGFAEYLAAGVAMIRRWSVGDDPLFYAGQALISAAVDCRRSGLDTPVPLDVLVDLQAHYLPPSWRHRSELPSAGEALAWACERVLGASSCLQPQGHDTYLAADYLLDHAQRDGPPLDGAPIPEVTWQAVLAAARPDRRFLIGVAAFLFEKDSIAERAFRAVSTKDGHQDTNAMLFLGLLLYRRGEEAEAEHFWLAAADQDHASAMLFLGELLYTRGEMADAKHWLRHTADRGQTNAMLIFGLLRYHRGEEAEAERLWRAAADQGNTEAMRSLGFVLNQRGDAVEAEHWLRAAADQGNTDAMCNLGLVLYERGETAEAERLWRAAADQGNTDAMYDLGAVLNQRGEVVEAECLLRAAADQGNTDAMCNLGFVLYERGETVEAERLWRAAADQGNTDAMTNLGVLLAERGDTTEAEHWWRTAADQGETTAAEDGD